MTDQEKYDASIAASKSGGPCPICDWRDGDGVRTCFYSKEYGVVTHENSDAAVRARLTAEQQSLYDSYESWHPDSAHQAGKPERLDHGRCRADAPEGATIRVWYLPHTCGGQPYLAEPYHITCTGCDVEVKLWEYGVDPDVG